MENEKGAESCKTCGHGQEAQQDGNIECHRRSPMVVAVPTPTGVAFISAFPECGGDRGWCSEYVPGTPRPKAKIIPVKKSGITLVR